MQNVPLCFEDDVTIKYNGKTITFRKSRTYYLHPLLVAILQRDGYPAHAKVPRKESFLRA